MGRYEILLFLHIVAAIIWIGVGLTGQALLVLAYEREEWEFGAKLQGAFTAIEIPAAILGPLMGLVTGAWMVIDSSWNFTDTWVLIGLGGWTGALALGLGYQAPGLRAFDAVVEERGPADPEAIRLAKRLNALMWPELAILTIVVLAMATKPSGAGSWQFWIIASLAAGAGVLLLSRGLRGVADDSPATLHDSGARTD